MLWQVVALKARLTLLELPGAFDELASEFTAQREVIEGLEEEVDEVMLELEVTAVELVLEKERNNLLHFNWLKTLIQDPLEQSPQAKKIHMLTGSKQSTPPHTKRQKHLQSPISFPISPHGLSAFEAVGSMM